MSMSKMIFLGVCLVGLTQFGWSQGVLQGNHAKGIPGFLNPQTRTFTARVPRKGPVQDADAVPTTLTEYAGIWTIKFAITVSSSVPSGAEVFCSADIYVEGYDSYDESVVGQATVSAGKGTCTLTVPYAWFLSNASGDSVYIDYDVSMIQGFTVGSASQGVSIRESSSSVEGTFTVPANGALSTTSITARL